MRLRVSRKYIIDFCFCSFAILGFLYSVNIGIAWIQKKPDTGSGKAWLQADDLTYLQGEISMDTVDQLVSAWKGVSSDHMTIVLDSQGGATSVASALGKALADAKSKGITFTAVVGRNNICMSACTTIFENADLRVADPTAIFMWHGVSSILGLPYVRPVRFDIWGIFDSSMEDSVRRFDKLHSYLSKRKAFDSYKNEVRLTAAQIVDLQPDFMVIRPEEGIQPSLLFSRPAYQTQK